LEATDSSTWKVRVSGKQTLLFKHKDRQQGGGERREAEVCAARVNGDSNEAVKGDGFCLVEAIWRAVERGALRRVLALNHKGRKEGRKERYGDHESNSEDEVAKGETKHRLVRFEPESTKEIP